LRRKWVLQYDDVMNQQRSVIYGYRNEVIQTEDPHALILEVIEEALPARVQEFLALEEEGTGTGHDALIHWVNMTFPIRLTGKAADELRGKGADEIVDLVGKRIRAAYDLKMAHENPDHAEELERYIILSAIDNLWREHLYAMDGLREGIGLRAQGQKDPLVEYKKEGYDLFVGLMGSIKLEILNNLFRSTTNPEGFQSFLGKISSGRTDLATLFGERPAPQPQDRIAAVPSAAAQDRDPGEIELPLLQIQVRREAPKIGRNDPCSCGSGKKFKQCCGRKA
jgi:preprotein translocase subunit SecA